MKKGIVHIIAGLFILLFVYTALSKLLAFEKFRLVLSTLPLAGKYASMLAVGIPMAELLIAALLFNPATAAPGIVAAVSLLAAFTIYLLFMVLTDGTLPCSCGGVIQQMSWKQHIVFNMLFIAAGIAAMRARYKEPANK